MQRIINTPSKIFFLGLIFLLLPLLTLAQKKVTLSGYVKDSESGETIIGATLFIKELKIGAQTNSYGLLLCIRSSRLLYSYYILCWLPDAR